MMPQNKASKFSAPSRMLIRDREDYLTDYEWGGVALNNPNLGLRHTLWQLKYDKLTSKMVIINLTTGLETTLFSNLSLVKRVGLAFDLNMRPTVCYVKDNLTYLWWYDTVTNQPRTDTFQGMTNPCISLDDTRLVNSSKSDIIFAYQVKRDLYFRQQRDRYQIPYLFKADTRAGILHQIGMNSGNRMQFVFK